MTSDAGRVFVWTWLPGATDPVVAGALAPVGATLNGEPVMAFRYAASYLARPEAVSLYSPELPLTDDTVDPRRIGGREPVPMPSCLRDAAPDAWGRRVINARLAGHPDRTLDEATYLLGSGSNRIGAIDFQATPSEYVARDEDAGLEHLLQLADLVEAGEPIPESLAAAAQHGTSIGGARPKAMLVDGTRQLIAKFPSSTDVRPVVQHEAVAMMLAARVGIDVPHVEVVPVAGRDVLLVERFDRVVGGDGSYHRRAMVSMLTVLGMAEHSARYASYAQMAEAIRARGWERVPETLRELFTRLVLNVCVGNTDDHLRNHAGFWSGDTLTLTPAYDVCPQVRSTDPASHAIGIAGPTDRASQLRSCRAVAPTFLLSRSDAEAVIDHVVSTITDSWAEVCDAARLTAAQRESLLGREILNPYIHYDAA
ncbi:MAG: type II toxin-antitoxin system HipA family toxin [Candidatus Nanopelagicales bacterium]